VVSPRYLGHVCPRLSHRRAAARPTHPEKGDLTQEEGGEERGMVSVAAELLPLTVPEVRRLLFALLWQALPAPDAVLHWSAWRRRHQAQAKRAHIRRRQRLTQVRL
jgi:hypothetical protein